MRNVLCALLFVLASTAAAAAPPRAAAVKAAGAIQVAGVLAAPAWAGAAWCTGFTSASAGGENAGAPRPAAIQTRFKVLFDASALTVGVECDERNPAGIRADVTEHDGTVWSDDCVEIFFDPDGVGRYYHHFLINTRGAWYDDYSADFGLVHGKLWDCPITPAARVDAGRKAWTAEVRIPFGALTLGEKAGSTWLWNVTRERHAGGALELTSWSPLKGNFHAPRLFGSLAGLDVDFRRFAVALGEPAVSVSGDGSGTRILSLQTRLTNQSPAARTLAGTLSLFGKPDTAVRAEKVEIAPGKDATVAFPRLAVRGGDPDALCLITFTDAGTGEIVKSAVKRLNADYRPLAIDVLEPVYRNNIYATQKLANVVFRLTPAEDVAARAAPVRWQLLDAAGTAARKGQFPANEVPEKCAFPVAGLADGKYRLAAEAIGKDGQVVARHETTLRKLPPPPAGNEVRIDEHRRIVVNGKPWLGIGWYGSIPGEDPRADVVALQNVQTPVVVIMPDSSGIGKAYAKGVYSFVSAENGRLVYSFSLWRKPESTVQKELSQLSAPSAEMVACVRELVAKVRAEPGVLGYYIADEPEINNSRSDYLENLYKLLAEEDPYHPVMVTNDTLDGIVTHGYRCADILNPDPYSAAFDYVPNFLKKVLEVGGRGKATMLTLWHSTGHTHFTDEWGTAPAYSYRVARNQYLVGVAYGSMGYTAYTTPFYLPEVQYRYGLPYVWREMRFLEKAILAPPPAEPLRVEAPIEMARWIRQADGNTYLMVVQHKPGQCQAKISHPLLRGVSRLYVLSEGREVAVQAGAFTDRFTEGDARVYTTDPRARDLKSVAAVEQELSERERACVKPGNLLHSSKGTRALASEGFYAPWFFQYFYYALNGITDDIGWAASHAGGKPAWFEVVLKQPARVGRIVLYTPNLKDYTLDLRAPDGSVQRVTVTDNKTFGVIEHNFRPALSCMKIRLTVTAVQPATCEMGNVPLLREIEAYEEPGAGPATPVTQAGAPVAPPAPAPVAAEAATAGPNAMWAEEFRNFESAGKFLWNAQDTKWVLNPENLRAQGKPAGGVAVACLLPSGAGMSHLFPYDPAYRFFQVNLSGIAGEGYRFTNVGFGVSSGAKGYRGAVNTARPGIYTVDTHAIHPDFREGKNKQCFVTVYASGAGKGADGTVRPGPEFTFEGMRLARRPENGLAVTLADGSPLPAVLKQGDELLFRLTLSAPAVDAAVEAKKSHEYSPLPMNGEPYVQLVKTDADGREWAGRVKLGPGTGKFALAGYPLVFRAMITGAPVKESYFSAFTSVE